MLKGNRGVDLESGLRLLNRILVVVLVVSVCAVALLKWRSISYAGGEVNAATETSETNDSNRVSVPCSFEYSEESYDIHPGGEYIVYTNYACPHCAELYFGARAKGIFYTSRLLLLEDGEGPFATQGIISAYMLKLCRADSSTFDALEAEVFRHQSEWTSLDEDGLIAWLNQRSGQRWTKGDFDAECVEISMIVDEAPDDLPYVPGVYQDGVRRDDLMYELLDAGVSALESLEED